MPLDKKYLFVFAGIGLAASGIVTILFILQGLSGGSATDDSEEAFVLEKIQRAHQNLVRHDHMTLGLYKNREQIKVPENIGISSKLWVDHSLDEFSRGLAPLHTHDDSGRIHIESIADRDFTFGEFLNIWGLDRSKIVRIVDVDGKDIEDYEHFVLTQDAILVMEITD